MAEKGPIFELHPGCPLIFVSFGGVCSAEDHQPVQKGSGALVFAQTCLVADGLPTATKHEVYEMVGRFLREASACLFKSWRSLKTHTS